MKKVLKAVLVPLLVAGTLGGCAYGAATVSGDKVVIARQDSFLFGALRKVFVCKIADTGLTGCAAAESP